MKNKIRWILLFIIPMMVLVIMSQVLWVQNNEVVAASNGSAVNTLNKIMEARKEGGLILFDSDEINEMLKTYIKDGISYKSFLIKGINTSINNGYITFVVPVDYKSIEVPLSIKGQVYLSKSNGSGGSDGNSGEKIIFKPDSFFVGKLPVAPKLAYSIINKEKLSGLKLKNQCLAVDISKLPVNITEAGLKGKRLYIYLQKNTSDETEISEKGASNTTSKIADSAKTDKKNTVSQKSKQNNTVKQSNNINIKTKEELLTLNSQLEKAEATLSTASQKKLINMLQSTIEKLAYNSSYNYMNDEAAVKAAYNNLPDSQKADLKTAVLSKVDTSTIAELMNTLMK